MAIKITFAKETLFEAKKSAAIGVTSPICQKFLVPWGEKSDLGTPITLIEQNASTFGGNQFTKFYYMQLS